MHRDGGWYCIGHDLDRGAVRVFRTSRISGDVTDLGAADVAVDPGWPGFLETYFANLVPMHAKLLVASDHGWTWRTDGTIVDHRSLGGIEYDVVQVPITERDGLIGALAAAAPHVLVMEPADLRMRVVEHLRGVEHG